MNPQHREAIDSCCEDIARRTDLTRLWPKLLEKKIFNRDDVNIPRWTRDLTKEEIVRDVYMTIKTRGPSAFKSLLESLRQSGHQAVADTLEERSLTGPRDVATNPKDDVNAADPAVISFASKKDQDSFYRSLQSTDQPLRICVQKATTFLDNSGSKDVQKYPMRSRPRGLVLLITNIEYRHMNSRTSAKHDENNLTELFEQMGFAVVCFRNLTGQDLADTVKEFSQREDLRRVDSCFVVISSHGNMENQYSDTEIQCVDYPEGDHKTVFCTEVMDCFTAEKCPHLAGKPKVFIFQLCRGKARQKVVKEPRHTTDTCNIPTKKAEKISDLKRNDKRSTRNYSDMIVVYSTIPNHVSLRDRYTGSWFIQIFCEVFMNYACTYHLQDLLNMVDVRLAIQKTNNEDCQTLMVTSIGFNKHCYLNPGLFE